MISGINSIPAFWRGQPVRFASKRTVQGPIQADLFTKRPESTPGLMRFAVIGDPGSGTKAQKAIAKEMTKLYDKTPFASVLVLGDNVYEDGEPHLFEERIYKPYQKLFEKGVRFYPILGNHDVREGHGDKQLAYWGAPRTGFYEFKVGPVDIFALDTTLFAPFYDNAHVADPHTAKTIGKIQLDWLDKALSKSQSKFKVVMGHYPIYTSGKRGKWQKMRRILEPLLEKHGVSLYLSGHDHLYERSEPLGKKTLHIISGAAGKIREAFFKDKAPYADRMKVTAKYHFMLFDIQGDKLSFQAIDRKGKVIDSGEVRPQRTAKAQPA